MDHIVISWQDHEYEHKPKGVSWFWVVGIIAAGIAIASFILQNYLFGLIAILGGFTVMLVGSARPTQHTFSLTDNGFKIGRDVIPYDKITRFAISEKEPRQLTLETLILIGVIKVPLEKADFRVIRSELKNRNIEEVDKLDQVVERVAKTIGL